MYARVVRFTGVTRETVEKVRAEVEASDGPPPGVRASGMKMLFDEDQGTSVFVAFFDSEQDMLDADRVFDAMDPGDTPGSRASVDRCEVAIEREA
ncbi:MAG: hypothetical protein KJ006_10010 [Thermoleophilia bacterium]|nr:hypothetical protein [Thermoleophilia bacterium]GIK78874.1 MAG: hypothetical protein BroJett022_25640 [Actinomycetes bacterium]